jgi:hypothetical protein
LVYFDLPSPLGLSVSNNNVRDPFAVVAAPVDGGQSVEANGQSGFVAGAFESKSTNGVDCAVLSKGRLFYFYAILSKGKLFQRCSFER